MNSVSLAVPPAPEPVAAFPAGDLSVATGETSSAPFDSVLGDCAKAETPSTSAAVVGAAQAATNQPAGNVRVRGGVHASLTATTKRGEAFSEIAPEGAVQSARSLFLTPPTAAAVTAVSGEADDANDSTLTESETASEDATAVVSTDALLRGMCAVPATPVALETPVTTVSTESGDGETKTTGQGAGGFAKTSEYAQMLPQPIDADATAQTAEASAASFTTPMTTPKAVATTEAQTSAAATTITAREKLAGHAGAIANARAVIVANPSENKFLVTENEADAKTEKFTGIGNAKSRPQMNASSESTAPAAVFTDARAVADSSGVTPVFQLERTSSAASRSGLEAAPVETIKGTATEAAGAVNEVVELTHEFRARERNSVEVKFTLKDQTELAVRLSYRDGQVQAHFRADSETLRATLSREWQSQAAAFAQDTRGVRVAEPVFTSSNDFSQSSSQERGSAAGGDARQQHHSAQSEESDARRAALSAGAFRGNSASATSAPARTPVRVSNDSLLHAFA